MSEGAAAGDALVDLRTPAGAREIEVAPLELREAPGARLLLHRGWRVEPARLEVVCATRPVPLWIDGLEAPILAGLSGMTRRHLALVELRPDAPARDGQAWTQTWAGRAEGGIARGRHVLGFDAAGDLLACTLACVAPHEEDCAPALGALVLAPALAPPAAGLAELAAANLVGHPRVVAGAVLAAALAIVAIILARRPRPASRRRTPAAALRTPPPARGRARRGDG